MGLTVDRVIELADRVGQLDPKAGLKLSSDEVEVVVTEIFIEKVEGMYRVRVIENRTLNYF